MLVLFFGLFFYVLEVLFSGGEMCFINLVCVYESFDEVIWCEIDGLCLINYNFFICLCEGGYGGGFVIYCMLDIELIQGSEYLLVCIYLESGWCVLFFSVYIEVEIFGYDFVWGQVLIGCLCEYLVCLELSYSYVWLVGDIVWWDNQVVLYVCNVFLVSEWWCLKCISLVGSCLF